ncbi:MAG: putative bifunctional diguanylate cyclase/phosphodiesterase [Pseudomonadota bacterium]
MLNEIANLTPGAFFRYVIREDGSHYFDALGLRVEHFLKIPQRKVLEDPEIFFNKVDAIYRAPLAEAIDVSWRTLNDFHFTLSLTNYEGESVWLDIRSQPVRHNDGSTLWTGFLYDVSARERTAAALQQHHRNTEHVLGNMLDSIITTDAHGNILFVNHAAQTLTGFTENELLGSNIKLVMPAHHRDQHDDYMENYKQTGLAKIIGTTREVNILDKCGDLIPVELRICEYKDGREQRFMGMLRDLRAVMDAQEQLARIRHIDPLTQLANRDGLLSTLQRELDASCDTRLYILTIDIDGFHLINDAFGTDAGDRVLQAFSTRLNQEAKNALCVARVHDDQFALIVEVNERESSIEKVYKSLKHRLEAYYQLEIFEGMLSISGGCLSVNVLQQPVQSSADILHNSELALKHAKDRQSSELIFYHHALTEKYQSSALIDHKLKQPGLLQDLFLEFQPLVESGGTIIGYEALIRWEHQGVLIRPDEFIYVAERNGTIIKIGQWVIDQVCQFIKSCLDNERSRHIRVSVNISPLQFQHESFVSSVKEAVARHCVTPGQLKFEITEQLLIESKDEVSRKIEKLSAMGINFSLDDFGTGYSSLAYLSRLPLNEVKIDKSFVRNLSLKSKNYPIVESIILMAYGLGLDVVAEGVESQLELDFLRRLGCVYYQGFYFSEPMRSSELSR